MIKKCVMYYHSECTIILLPVWSGNKWYCFISCQCVNNALAVRAGYRMCGFCSRRFWKTSSPGCDVWNTKGTSKDQWNNIWKKRKMKTTYNEEFTMKTMTDRGLCGKTINVYKVLHRKLGTFKMILNESQENSSCWRYELNSTDLGPNCKLMWSLW